MIKVFIWRVSNDTSFQDKAIKILEQQHNGIEIVGVTADAETSLIYEGKNVTFIPFTEVNRGGGGMILSSSSVQDKAATWTKSRKPLANSTCPKKNCWATGLSAFPASRSTNIVAYNVRACRFSQRFVSAVV